MTVLTVSTQVLPLLLGAREGEKSFWCWESRVGETHREKLHRGNKLFCMILTVVG